MSAILKSLNAHSFTFGQPILMKLESKPMVYRALSYKHTYHDRVAVPFNVN